MDNAQIIALVVVFAVLALVIYYQFAGKKGQLTIANDDGSTVTVGIDVADTTLKKMRGLMFRSSLPENEGMLFVFDKPGRYGFWMVNTTIPLDAIHLSSNGTVVDIIKMDPCGFECRVYSPKADAQYVLEVNQGFSERHNIAIGSSRALAFPAG